MIDFKNFNVYTANLNSYEDAGEWLHTRLDNCNFTVAHNWGKPIDSCLMVRSIYEDGCLSPAIAWVNGTQDDVYFHPGNTRLQAWKAFHDFMKIPVIIIDPHRTEKSTDLITNAFLNATLTDKVIDFRMRKHRSGCHRFYPVFDNLDSKQFDNFLFYDKYTHWRHEYVLNVQLQPKRLDIIHNNQVIYSIGGLHKDSYKYHVDFPWQAWYAFSEYTGVYDDCGGIPNTVRKISQEGYKRSN